MFYFIYIYKAMATLLITNSHFGNLYPEKYSFLAFGGALGNAMFFANAGFLLGRYDDNFFKWMKKKIVRILPSVWIVNVILLISGADYILDNTCIRILCSFIFPTFFWFVNAILIMYILLFIIQKYISKYLNYIILLSIMIYFVVMIMFVDIQSFNVEYNYTKCFYYFIAMLLGYAVRTDAKKIRKRYANKNKFWLIGAIGGFLGYGIGSVIIKIPGMLRYQICVHIMIIICVICLLVFLLLNEERIKNKKNTFYMKMSYFLSSITLEIYLLNDWTIEYFGMAVFPINMIVVLTIIIGGAFCIHAISKKIDIFLEKRINI